MTSELARCGAREDRRPALREQRGPRFTPSDDPNGSGQSLCCIHPRCPKRCLRPPEGPRTVRTREYAYGRLPGCKKRRGRYRIPLCHTNATSALQLIASLKEPYTSASTISARACMPREPGGIGGTRSATHTSPRPRDVSSAGPKKKGPAEPLPSIAITTKKKCVRHDPMHHA